MKLKIFVILIFLIALCVNVTAQNISEKSLENKGSEITLTLEKDGSMYLEREDVLVLKEELIAGIWDQHLQIIVLFLNRKNIF